ARVTDTRCAPRFFHPAWPADPVEVLNKVAAAQDIDAALQGFEPQQPEFVALKAARAKELTATEQEPPVQDREASKKHRGRDVDERSRKNTADTIIANME